MWPLELTEVESRITYFPRKLPGSHESSVNCDRAADVRQLYSETTFYGAG